MAAVRVSGCIITQGAPEMLEGCLEDMADFVDEIVVVDGGGDESTRSLAESKPRTRYISSPWPGNISRQRNVYIREARGEWIFTMDTDERLEPGFGSGLEDWIQDESISGACFPRPWRVDQDHFVLSANHYPDFNFRLIRNRPEVSYRDGAEFAVHHAFHGLRGSILLLKAPLILHDIFIHEDKEERRDKIRLYDGMSSNQSGSRFKSFYLYEDYPHQICRLSERPALDAYPQVAEVPAST